MPVLENSFQGKKELVNGGSNYNSLKVSTKVALVKSSYMLEHPVYLELVTIQVGTISRKDSMY